MKYVVYVVSLVSLCIMLFSCSTSRKPLDLEIPDGIVIATDTQSKLVVGIIGISRGMSQNKVNKTAGATGC